MTRAKQPCRPPLKAAINCHPFRLLLTACCLVLISGCGDSRRQELEGTVTLDGRVLERGQIRFRPAAGTAGPTAGAEIIQGKFLVSSGDGPFVGTFRVEIAASRKSGKKIPAGPSGELVDAYQQFLPERYNRQSELEVEVTADGPNHFEFALTSK